MTVNVNSKFGKCIYNCQQLLKMSMVLLETCRGLQCNIYYYRTNKLCIKSVIETSLHYDARSEKYQTTSMFLQARTWQREGSGCGRPGHKIQRRQHSCYNEKKNNYVSLKTFKLLNEMKGNQEISVMF